MLQHYVASLRPLEDKDNRVPTLSNTEEDETAALKPVAGDECTTTLTLDGGPGRALVEQQSKQSGWFTSAVVVSVFIHFAVVWAGLQVSDNVVLGGADTNVETISVEIITEAPRAAASAPAVVASVRAEPPPTRKPVRADDMPRPDQRELSKATADDTPHPDPTSVVTEPSPDKVAKKREAVPPPEDFPLKLSRAPSAADFPYQSPYQSDDIERKSPATQDEPQELPRIEDFPAQLPKRDQDPPKRRLKPPIKKTTKSPQIERPKQPARTKTPEPKPKQTDRTALNSAASSPQTPQVAIRNRRITSASKGALRRFARKIASALARSRPRRMSGIGTVVVAFTLSESGSLQQLFVKKSSGKARIDRVAMRAVRRTKFPKPPRGATRQQRSFVIPYHFRRR